MKRYYVYLKTKDCVHCAVCIYGFFKNLNHTS